MKDRILAHMGSLLGGVVHNLNTPLMWVMGRAQLIQSRTERVESYRELSDEDLATFREKNTKDISSILEGAEKIDAILKGLGYKIQMVNEGYTSVELREYLEMETNFLLADMRFKH
ncbi:MAG TPA: histidine kinase dimerization/phospho-acceptor domain-containing protein, partial [Deltaproteobacteria bacterium]|nr:histidine kinase dimerization/phospho-acceptor domain-containing protein [Deltaproteobacteria bacterium]